MKRVAGSFFRLSLCGLALGAVGLVTCPVFAVVPADGETSLFFDDFDAFAPGALPPGWEIVWDGADYDLQMVSDLYGHSGTNSFQLVGRPGWSAVAQRSITADSPEIGYEFKILIESAAPSGEEHPAFFSHQAEGNLWGTYYGAVRFDHASRAVLSEEGTALATWDPLTWYTVRVILDRTAKTYDVWIDDAQVGFELPINAHSPELIDALALVSGHAGVPVYYDDVSVFAPGSDSDGDGIPDAVDPCPFVNPGLIDINVDGCVDTNIVIATYVREKINPVATELPDAAMDCVEGAVLNLEIEAYQTAVENMLCAVEVLDAAGTPPAADAEYAIGLSAQTTALLAIELTAQVVGHDDPNVIAATTLAELGVELLETLEIPGAVKDFLDAISQLLEPATPAILVEVKRRNSNPFIWEKHTYTFAAWGEEVVSPIRVTNVGNVDLTDVRVWQTWSNYRANVGDLPVGESRILNMGIIDIDMFGYRVRQWDPDPFYMMTTGVGKYAGEWVTGGASCEVDIIHPSIDVTIQGPDFAKPGEFISIRVTVTNTGDVVLRDVWYVMLEGIRDYEVIGDMAPGESRFYYYHYLVPRNARGNIKFKARAMGGRDYDFGLSWQFFGRRISDSETHKVKIRRSGNR